MTDCEQVPHPLSCIQLPLPPQMHNRLKSKSLCSSLTTGTTTIWALCCQWDSTHAPHCWQKATENSASELVIAAPSTSHCSISESPNKNKTQSLVRAATNWTGMKEKKTPFECSTGICHAEIASHVKFLDVLSSCEHAVITQNPLSSTQMSSTSIPLTEQVTVL